MNEGRDARGWLVAPAVLFLGLFSSLSRRRLLLLSITSPQTGLQNFATLFSVPVYLKALWNTVIISGLVTLLCALFAFPLPTQWRMPRPVCDAFLFSSCWSLSGQAFWCVHSRGWCCFRRPGLSTKR